MLVFGKSVARSLRRSVVSEKSCRRRPGPQVVCVHITVFGGVARGAARRAIAVRPHGQRRQALQARKRRTPRTAPWPGQLPAFIVQAAHQSAAWRSDPRSPARQSRPRTRASRERMSPQSVNENEHVFKPQNAVTDPEYPGELSHRQRQGPRSLEPAHTNFADGWVSLGVRG